MSLGWDLAAALPELRAQANSRMTEVIRAGRYTDGTDPVTGDATSVFESLYEGPARVKYTSNAITGEDATAAFVTTQKIVVSIPVQPAALLPGDETEPGEGTLPASNPVLPGGTGIEVLSSTSDQALVGRRYTTEGVPDLGQVTAHRYSVSELD